ncbi:MAG: hypothetical protein Q7T77_03820 [Sulfuricurvum sp.]|nr:hypothetical protein [Sulfuricurvum sp.]
MQVKNHMDTLLRNLLNYLFFGLTWTFKNKGKMFFWWMFIAYGIGVIGYSNVIMLYPDEPLIFINHPLLSSFLWAFINQVYGSTDNLADNFITISKTITIMGLGLAVILSLLKDWVEKQKLWIMKKFPHTIVIGLGQNNRNYLDGELLDNKSNDRNIIIIEKDSENDYIEHYREKGFGVYVGLISEYDLNISQLDRVVIATGSDIENIEQAGLLIKKSKELTTYESRRGIVAHIHLENQNYKVLFQQKILSANEGLNLEFKPYSFNDEAARGLFQQHTVLGNYYEVAHRFQQYSIMVLGDGNLAERIIYHLCMQASLPNQNICTIHCISENSEQFLERLRANFSGIDDIGYIQLRGLSLSLNIPEFYSHDVWSIHNLTNVIVAFDDDKRNLECAINLHDKVYLQQLDTMKTKVHFALFDDNQLGESIDKNSGEFKEFYTFGNAQTIFSKEHFIDETHENIAKQIHNGYGEKFEPEMTVNFGYSKLQKKQDVEAQCKINSINKKWYDISGISDRESNRSQALHIDTKLMSMDLKRESAIDKTDLENQKEKQSYFNKFRFILKKLIKALMSLVSKKKPVLDNKEEKLLSDNKKAIQSYFNEFGLIPEKLIEASCQLELEYAGFDFDKSLLGDLFKKTISDDSMISKLVRAEHERWSAYHYLNGWKYNKIKNKKTKQHDCLLPLTDFVGYDQQKTILYDLYSVLYIPNYLASAGYRIVKIDEIHLASAKNEPKKIGVGITGHRNIDRNDKKLKLILTEELKRIFEINDKVTLLSPLAEGSDRMFVDTAFQIGEEKIQKLRVMMPFEKNVYLKDFETAKSKEEFLVMTPEEGSKQYRGVDVEILTVPCQEIKEDAYLKSGQWTAKNSDILIVIWDGKPANGKGGTAEIIEYAKQEEKKIIWINPNNYEVVR